MSNHRDNNADPANLAMCALYDVAVRITYKLRCDKHNMIYEYCGYCNRIEYADVVKVPLPVRNRVTGQPVLNKDGSQRVWFLEKEVNHTTYRRYR